MAASTTFRHLLLQTSSCCLRINAKRIPVPNKQQINFLSISSQSCCSSGVISNSGKVERDPFPVFLQDDVQKLLSKITGFDALKLAGPHLNPLRKPVYKLLTDEQLQATKAEVEQRLRLKLQMPPYMNPDDPDPIPLATDPALDKHDTSDFVFTDVTFGLKDTERTVVIRKTDGTLQKASWRLRERMNQLYNPQEGRNYVIPAMFKEEHLKRLISEKKYEYILDRACVQFEPNDPEFVRVTHEVYKGVHESRDYDLLRSTRHFGSLSFHLIWHRQIDNLLVDMLDRARVEDARDLVLLMTVVHPDSQCASSVAQLSEPDDFTVIKTYLETDCNLKERVELSLQSAQICLQSEAKEEKSSVV